MFSFFCFLFFAFCVGFLLSAGGSFSLGAERSFAQTAGGRFLERKIGEEGLGLSLGLGRALVLGCCCFFLKLFCIYIFWGGGSVRVDVLWFRCFVGSFCGLGVEGEGKRHAGSMI